MRRQEGFLGINNRRSRPACLSIAITGIAGQVGHHLGAFLRTCGHEVIGIDIKEPPSGCCDRFYKIDITYLKEENSLMHELGLDALIHLAAVVAPTDAPDEHIMRVNVLGTYQVLRWAAQHRISKVIFISSESVLGFAFAKRALQPYYVPIDENHPLLAHDAYGLSKLLGEQLCRAFQIETNSTIFCLRPPWIWIPEKIERYLELIKHPEVWVHGLWAYIVIEDLCEVINFILTKDFDSGYYVFFVNADDNGTDIPTKELLRKFYNFNGPFSDKFESYDSVISSNALKTFLEWKPKWSWRTWLQSVQNRREVNLDD